MAVAKRRVRVRRRVKNKLTLKRPLPKTRKKMLPLRMLPLSRLNTLNRPPIMEKQLRLNKGPIKKLTIDLSLIRLEMPHQKNYTSPKTFINHSPLEMSRKFNPLLITR